MSTAKIRSEPRPTRRRPVLLCAALVLLLLLPRSAAAHEGELKTILSQEQLGPYTVDVLADPDIGTGFILISIAVQGAPAPQGTTVAVTASRGGLTAHSIQTEARLETTGDTAASRFRADLPFDRDSDWDIQLRIDGPAGSAQTSFPLLVGSQTIWQIRLLFPVIAVAALGATWLVKKREERRKLVGQAPQQNPSRAKASKRLRR